AHRLIRARRASEGVLLALLLTIPATSGCNTGRSSSSWFSARSSRDALKIALEDPRPDERRKAVADLAASRDAKSDWAFKAFDTIARTDTDPLVRVEAVRGLGRSSRPEAVKTLIKLLASADADVSDVRPPAPAPVRWEA